VNADGTCLTVADEPQLRKEFGVSKGNYGDRKYPLVRLVCLCLAETMTVIDYRLGGYCDDENALLAPMLKTLRKGDLLVGDRHFAGANLYWNYTQNGLEYLTRLHQRKNPQMPKYIVARFIRVQVRSRGHQKSIWLVTSLLDAECYPADDL